MHVYFNYLPRRRNDGPLLSTLPKVANELDVIYSNDKPIFMPHTRSPQARTDAPQTQAHYRPVTAHTICTQTKNETVWQPHRRDSDTHNHMMWFRFICSAKRSGSAPRNRRRREPFITSYTMSNETDPQPQVPAHTPADRPRATRPLSQVVPTDVPLTLLIHSNRERRSDGCHPARRPAHIIYAPSWRANRLS